MRASLTSLITGIAAVVISTSVFAHGYKVGDLQIGHPYSSATAPGQANGAGYLSIENTGKSEDELVSADSPYAESVEIHTSGIEGGVMKMRMIEKISIKAGEKVSLKPGGGYHLMLMKLKQPMTTDAMVPLTLHFKHAGSVKVELKVNPIGAAPAVEDHHHH